MFRVLIVDDKDENHALLAEMLGRIGFDIREVADGEGVVQKFGQWHPHLILMDTQMPVRAAIWRLFFSQSRVRR